jgi:hypothetical protein
VITHDDILEQPIMVSQASSQDSALQQIITVSHRPPNVVAV